SYSTISLLLFFILLVTPLLCFFFFNDPATPEIYTLSLHDALPILLAARGEYDRARASYDALLAGAPDHVDALADRGNVLAKLGRDRKSTRLNSSHLVISYAVFCLKKKKNKNKEIP